MRALRQFWRYAAAANAGAIGFMLGLFLTLGLWWDTPDTAPYWIGQCVTLFAPPAFCVWAVLWLWPSQARK